MHTVASRRTLLCGGLLALMGATLAVAFLWTSSSNSTPGKVTLRGQMLNIQNFAGPGCDSQATPPVCSSFNAVGSFTGPGVATIDTFPTGYPRALSDAHTVITTKKGELHCTETAIFDLTDVPPPPTPPPPGDHAFVDLCLINGKDSTGVYAGAKGYIQEVGTFDFSLNLGEIDYYGEITSAS
jgi:hypothetical protein